ncbi:uncharacterized protein N7484_010571 [Penicillium longicatenatum]|uniref:uncharacterized protein n=1 Tax=Penicillium longicatenatum TaxID=1561947 RepID=UPI0025471000|nr:uncharacterized protein N7484_010571 [Penicillium longicatenatum]KAJ5630471.1 hypothetical protein N7484_010571 [Penicillium longicatenatum]
MVGAAEEERMNRRRVLARVAQKRSKVTRACDSCKARKKACTGDIPCRFCVRIGANCTYNVPYHRGSAARPPPSSRQAETAMGPRPPASQPLPTGPSPALTNSSRGDPIDLGGQYRGPASAHSFLDRAVREFDHQQHGQAPFPSTPEDAHASIFSFGDRQAPQIPPAQLQWPTRAVVDQLVRRYFDFASPTYRILHQGTVENWVNLMFDQEIANQSGPATAEVSLASRAIILIQCAIASLSATPCHTNVQQQTDHLDWQKCEAYYQLAEQMLSKETGVPTLESAQARFLTVLYLLGTSRMNQAWFNFGQTVQLLMTIGVHRKQTRSDTSRSEVALQCSKRLLWCCFTLDQYLSLILGRPRLLREEDIDQDYPSLINDENIDSTQSSSSRARNCLMDAPVCHAKLSRILAKASQELYSIHPGEKVREIDSMEVFLSQINEWQSALPPLLGDSVCPSSLISIFQRQLTVIRLAHYHAIMFVTRPLLLWAFSEESENPALKSSLLKCITTARKTLELVLELVQENQLLPTFWYTQYIAFNALSIAYIYLINSKKGRIPPDWVTEGDTEELATQTVAQASLYDLAEKTQYYLGQATELNSLAWRYTFVLDALKSECHRRILGLTNVGKSHPPTARPSQGPESNMQSQSISSAEGSPGNGIITEQSPIDWQCSQQLMEDTDLQASAALYGIENLFPMMGPTEEPILDFWPQLDRLPTCKKLPFSRTLPTHMLISLALTNYQNL